jgi:hypothetical protein
MPVACGCLNRELPAPDVGGYIVEDNARAYRVRLKVLKMKAAQQRTPSKTLRVDGYSLAAFAEDRFFMRVPKTELPPRDVRGYN